MGDLSDYKSLNEKKEFYFLNKQIETEKEFDLLWKQLESFREHNPGDIYRGASEAKYKMYSGAQRYWHNKGIVYGGYGFHEYVQINIDLSKKWNNGFVINHLSNQGMANDVIAVLSIMQHYRIPTPLLDFTKNPYYALYFATSKSTNELSVVEIENYSSLYFVNAEYWSIKFAFQEFHDNWTHGKKEDYQKLSRIPFLLINDTEAKFLIRNNENIIRQEGLFIFSEHQDLPFAEKFKITMELIKSHFQVDHAKSQLLSCWNINKSLNPYIRKRLAEEKGITEKYLFPETNLLPDFVNEFWEKERINNPGLERYDFLMKRGLTQYL